MIRSMLNRQPESNRVLREMVDANMLSVKSLHEKAAQDTLRSEVNLLLKEKKGDWLHRLSELMRSEEHRLAKQLDDGLMVVDRLCLLHEENKDGTSLLCKVSSVDEMREVYQRTVFYLRRMELDMADEECTGFLELLEAWNFSAEYLLMVLGRGPIYQRVHAGNRLGCLLLKNGYQDYAESVLAWVDAQMNQG